MNEMIMVQESKAEYKISKPVICPKCDCGKLGYISDSNETIISQRGRPPPGELDNGLQVKCPVCKKLWTLIIT
jgi:phage FluMu protein Com